MALEPTCSRQDVMQHLGCKATKLWELMRFGKKFHGVHPLKGGLWPWWPVSHKNVRIEVRAVTAHKAHLQRLRDDAMFANAMKAKARSLGLSRAA